MQQPDHTQQDDYFKQPTQKLADNAPPDPNLEFGRICYETLETPSGKRLVEMIKERILAASLVAPQTPNYSTLVIYYDGFKAALKSLIDSAAHHQKMVVSR